MISKGIFYTFATALRIERFVWVLLWNAMERKTSSESLTTLFLCGNAQIVKTGTTGFDSKDSEFVSIPSYEITLVKPNFNFLNGENNYALAA